MQSEENVPNDGLVHSGHSPKRISKKIVEEFAVQRYRKCGQGIDFSDVSREFECSKPKAQRILKDSCQQGNLFTPLKRTSTQQFFPTCIKSEIVEHLSKRKNVLINPTGVNHSSTSLSSDVSNVNDQVILETLEGHILPLLPAAPLSLHNLHLKTSVTSERYEQLGGLSPIPGNKGKKHSQIIGTSNVDYTLYPRGTVNVEVMCSNHPFRVQTEEDRSRLLGFFGQQQQVLMSILSDSHQRIVPNFLEWEVTECDINKDIKVSDWFHWIGQKIQVKHMDHLFSLYIKKMGKDTVYRVEERKHPHKPVINFINDVFNPSEKVDSDYTNYIRDPEMNLLTDVHDDWG
jgi:hypothetical protein